MSLSQKDSVDTSTVDLGADPKVYQKELKARYDGLKGDKSKAKLTLEIDDKLIQEYVVQLLDHGMRSGFTNIAPVPIDQKKR
jgi:hypothetical protein